jgi:hypothetical protein
MGLTSIPVDFEGRVCFEGNTLDNGADVRVEFTVLTSNLTQVAVGERRYVRAHLLGGPPFAIIDWRGWTGRLDMPSLMLTFESRAKGPINTERSK